MNNKMTDLENLNRIIEYFQGIPAKKWTVGTQFDSTTGRRCALGWLNPTVIGDIRGQDTEDAKFIHNLAPTGSEQCRIATVNNGWDEEYQQSTPNERVLNFLSDLRQRIIKGELSTVTDTEVLEGMKVKQLETV